tara:strand:+ start:6466 stop:7266 length:801 start_codon:yes stop_codon:yes gene_type:complete
MRVTLSNNISNNIPKMITGGISEDLPKNVIKPDFSDIYVSSDPQRLTMSFGVVNECDYIAVAGLNISGNGNGTSRVRVSNAASRDAPAGEAVTIRTVNVTNDQVVVIQFPKQSFTDLRIGLYKETGIGNPSVAYVAAGLSFEVPNGGEQAGYNRQFLARNNTNKTTVDGLSAPISQLRKKKQARGKLSIPNATKEFSETTYQTFLDFASSNIFFITEQEGVYPSQFTGTNASSYLCYDLGNNSVSAHAMTRSLNVISFDFRVFNGL